MRTNIDLDPALVAEAFRYADVRTKKELVHLALQEFIAQRRRLDPRELRGKIAFAADDDYEPLRGESEDA